MYYIMNEFDGRILEAQHNRPTQKELQGTANFMQCEVYVIQGQHIGMTAAPDSPDGDIEELDTMDLEGQFDALMAAVPACQRI